MCDEYKKQALRVKCSLSTKKWRAFCVSQLSRNVGARVLHRYANRQNAPSPVPLFKPGALHKTPNDAVDADAAHWAGFWQKPRDQCDAHEVLEKCAMRVLLGLGLKLHLISSICPLLPLTCCWVQLKVTRKLRKDPIIGCLLKSVCQCLLTTLLPMQLTFGLR